MYRHEELHGGASFGSMIVGFGSVNKQFHDFESMGAMKPRVTLSNSANSASTANNWTEK